LVKKHNSSKKTDSKKTDSKKTIMAVVICAVISSSVLIMSFGIFNENLPETSDNLPETSDNLPETSDNLPETSDNLPETSDNLPEISPTMSNYIESLTSTHTIQIALGVPYFDFYFTDADLIRVNNGFSPIDGVRINLNDDTSEKVISALKPNESTVVIYPIFTSAAYQEPGFYTYFRGDCDESCVTDISFETPKFLYTSSGLTAQILYHVGYDFLTDIDVDQNPEQLQNYDTVILLHNEYLTKKAFDAISSHPNLIFLAPNALYAEIDVNYDTNTMTLIRGHQYPPPEKPANGFDYAIEEKFHKYEYDDECLEWEFIEIENGFHLNCYPESVMHQNLDILIKMKEL